MPLFGLWTAKLDFFLSLDENLLFEFPRRKVHKPVHELFLHTRQQHFKFHIKYMKKSYIVAKKKRFKNIHCECLKCKPTHMSASTMSLALLILAEQHFIPFTVFWLWWLGLSVLSLWCWPNGKSSILMKLNKVVPLFCILSFLPCGFFFFGFFVFILRFCC